MHVKPWSHLADLFFRSFPTMESGIIGRYPSKVRDNRIVSVIVGNSREWDVTKIECSNLSEAIGVEIMPETWS